MLYAPISNTDLWTIRGTTGNKIEFPAVPGDEGVGVIEDPGNSSFSRGDWVVPMRPGLGLKFFLFQKYSNDII